MGKLILVAVKHECALTSTSSDYDVKTLGISSKEFSYQYFENRVQGHPAGGSSGGQGQQSHTGAGSNEQENSAIERNDGEDVMTGAVPDPNDSHSGLANSGQESYRMDAGPPRGHDRDGPVVDLSELKPYTSPRYPDELDCTTVNRLQELVDRGDAYVIVLGGWWKDFLYNVMEQVCIWSAGLAIAFLLSFIYSTPAMGTCRTAQST